ncbi:MAG: hypothetical protein FWD58_00425 [Firmicutes bacterium]|nr:hypothetical protein [Bacillota bacterium]
MPQRITSKDLTELSELMESESLAYKKCVNYATMVSDPVLKEKLGCYANNHRIRFEKLLGYLNSAQ